MSNFFDTYSAHVEERQKEGVPPLALSARQTEELVALLQDIPTGKGEELLDLLTNRINPGVDPAAKVKADFLVNIATGKSKCEVINPSHAVKLLGTMVGGYNLDGLLDIISKDDAELSPLAATSLKNMVLAVNAFDDVKKLADGGNTYAKDIVESWAKGEWFTSKEDVPDTIKAVVYKISGEINTDDFSPASFAFTRADIPLHAKSLGGGLFPDGPQEITLLKEKHSLPVAFVGDVVGTGSSRKSACNSLIWYIGDRIDYIPNKKSGGVVIGSLIAPIFFNTAEDSGALPIQADVSKLVTGNVITVYPKKGEICAEDGSRVTSYDIKPDTILDEFKAGGRVPLIIGKQLTGKARESLGMSTIEESGIFVNPSNPEPKADQGYTLAQKMVGKACDLPGVLPGTACLPKMATVGSQDTTGPMTVNEMTELACLKFNTEMVMQSFCHTAAYPKPADIITHNTLPDYFSSRGGLALRPGDGVIHSWINRLLVPDTVGTGGDSHTRFPVGISFPAGSGLVAFAAALGSMPLDMPESVLVRFSGELQPGITLRDLVNFIPYTAIQKGLLTVPKEGKKNVFAGRILEMEGLPNLTVEQAFELTDATAERSAASSTIRLSKEPVIEFMKSNIALMEAMIEKGYQNPQALSNRIDSVKEWLAHPQLLEPDENAEYAAVIEINLNEMTEPVVACPNDPDDVKLLSEVAGDKVDDVFIGSCMTNIGQFRAAAAILDQEGFTASQLWFCPPTIMDAAQLRSEGIYSIFANAGSRAEIAGCSLCMGNQARIRDNVTAFSTSTRNFNNRMGTGARCYLGSSELAAVVALKGAMPTPEEYREIVNKKLSGKKDKIYRYLNFHEMENVGL